MRALSAAFLHTVAYLIGNKYALAVASASLPRALRAKMSVLGLKTAIFAAARRAAEALTEVL